MTTLVHNNSIQDTIQHWKHISSVIHEPQNADDYNKLSSLLDTLLDMVGEDESHELIGLVDVISHMIVIYDEENCEQLEKTTGVDALKFLIEQHNLKQTDLKNEIGSQGVVSEILSGKRQLNVVQIKKLSERFQVSADTFID